MKSKLFLSLSLLSLSLLSLSLHAADDTRLETLTSELGGLNTRIETLEKKWGSAEDLKTFFKNNKDDLKGVNGERGLQGEPGINGERGLQGDPGKDGVNGERGLQGEPGLQGDPGKDGVNGERGLQGEPGVNGANGERGFQGETGANGEHGFQGDPGINGANGERGVNGERGLQGERGEKGDMANLTSENILKALTDNQGSGMNQLLVTMMTGEIGRRFMFSLMALKAKETTKSITGVRKVKDAATDTDDASAAAKPSFRKRMGSLRGNKKKSGSDAAALDDSVRDDIVSGPKSGDGALALKDGNK